MMINAGRYSNTLFRGGRFDVAEDAGRFATRRARKMGAFKGSSPAVEAGDPRMFFGRRTPKAGQSPFIRQSLRTNLSPFGIGRLGSKTQLSGNNKTGFYTPFQTIPMALNAVAKRSSYIRGRFGIGAEDTAYSGGLLGRMMSMTKSSRLESQIAQLEASGKSPRKLKKLKAKQEKLIQNIIDVQNFANPAQSTVFNPVAAEAAADSAAAAAKSTVLAEQQRLYGGLSGMSDDMFDALTPPGVTRASLHDDVLMAERNARAAVIDAARTAAAENLDAIRNNPTGAIGRTMTPGKISNAISSFYGGVLNPELMTRAQQKVFHAVATRLGAQSGIGTNAFKAKYMADFGTTGKYAGGFLKEMAGSKEMIKMAFKYLSKGGLSTGGSIGTAAKFAGMGALKGAGLLMPGLNVLATASLVYDVTKGIGKIAVRGQNFAKDALKSMQGSINKPLFGTGFVDNEITASSRARGVMAIQNSRLNARSLLGSEAAMMAAHFG